jgi:hypothetical protein
MLGAAPAFADPIGDAAKKLSAASYPFLKEVDWNSGLFLQKVGSASAFQWLQAVDKAIVMGASMDPQLLKAGVEAHHKAIGSAGKDGVTSQADYEAVNAAIGRMIASVPQDQVMDVYNAFEGVLPKDVPEYLMSTVKEADAKAAYAALMEFKDVVKANPIAAGSVASKAAPAAAKVNSVQLPTSLSLSQPRSCPMLPTPSCSPWIGTQTSSWLRFLNQRPNWL